MHKAACPVPERKRPRADEPMASEESAFPCEKCDMIARSKTGLRAHIRARHPEDPKRRTSPSAHPTACFTTLRILPPRFWQHWNSRMPQKVPTYPWNPNFASNNTSNLSTK
ncbi:uncharacterized protein TM35_000271300 [Trypanosoma theileri]|uniref:C2H2-type domain-containing protein n=1 Tax=Trypanosoma theileri TaxID=67003 RepID=A0A1X0NQZ5_9TRYP|nr:uncharacterized protein TM35_000271300 [Trypanosoma theileri]ORC86540.1 hypothetical protein TM35_000271300 [Trypanosoma theileri]